MKKFLLLAVALMGVALGSKAQTDADLTAVADKDVFYAKGVAGQIGSTMEVPIYFHNGSGATNAANCVFFVKCESPYVTFQTESNDGINLISTSTTGTDHGLASNVVSAGTEFKCAFVTPSNKYLSEGPACILYLDVDPSAPVGDIEFVVYGSDISYDPTGEIVTPDELTSTLHLQRAAVIEEIGAGYSVNLVPAKLSEQGYGAGKNAAFDVVYTSASDFDELIFTVTSDVTGLNAWASTNAKHAASGFVAPTLVDGVSYSKINSGNTSITYTIDNDEDLFAATTVPTRIGTIYVDAKSAAEGAPYLTVSNIQFRDIASDVTLISGGKYLATVFIGDQTETDPIVYGALTAEGIANVNANINPEATNLDITSTSFVDASTEIAPGKNVAVYAAEGVTAMANVLVAGNTCANMNLVDGADFAPATGFTATSATYQRDVTSKFGTLCLPYPVEATAGMKLYVLESVDVDANVMNFAEAANVAANTPVVFYTEDGHISVNASNVNITTSPAGTALNAGKELVGTFAETTITSGYYIAQDKFWKANSAVTIPAFRAYFNMASLGVKSFTINLSDETGIQQLNVDTESGEIYDLAGRKLGKTQRGVNIVNGKKMLVK